MSKKKIVLTGGGTTGHVSVNLALIPKLLEEGWDIHYFGSKSGIERELVENIEGVTYHSIVTGKLRRYLSFQNILDIFKVGFGILQAAVKILFIRPNVIFSKGGFVSVPVIVGGWLNRVPSIAHESDLTPGLANKLVQPFVKKIFTTFKETVKYIKSGKGQFLGPVIREDLTNGSKEVARKFLAITNDKPTLLAMGGSLGASFINSMIRDNLDSLLENYNIIHSCGKDGLDTNIQKDGYYQFEYIKEHLNDIFTLTDIVVSRSGSNAIFEFLYHQIPMLLIPLPTSRSRGDQIQNAKAFEEAGFANVIDEDSVTSSEFVEAVNYMFENRLTFIKNMETFEFSDTIDVILENINNIKK